MSSFLEEFDAHVAERAAMEGEYGTAPKPLDASQAGRVIDELKADGQNEKLQELLDHRVPPGVDEAAYGKATWLSALATGKESYISISCVYSVELLGTMQGGYNVATMVDLLKDPEAEIAEMAAKQLSGALSESSSYTRTTLKESVPGSQELSLLFLGCEANGPYGHIKKVFLI
jgi:aconitate hydratase 2/2-methylisocitrate dehydratase